jgi:hypothetical protein
MLEDNCHLAVFINVVPISASKPLERLIETSACIIDFATEAKAYCPTGPIADNLA